MNQIPQQGQHCPYLVVAAFPDRIPQVIGRMYNQIDAEAHVHFLRQRLAHGKFFLIYEPAVADMRNLSGQIRQEGEESAKQA